MPTVQIERRRRGFFGWIVAILFWGWQILMALWLFAGFNSATTVYSGVHSDAARAGATIGVGLGVGFVLVVWVLGTVILGFMMMFTRGRRELITEERS